MGIKTPPLRTAFRIYRKNIGVLAAADQIPVHKDGGRLQRVHSRFLVLIRLTNMECPSDLQPVYVVAVDLT